MRRKCGECDRGELLFTEEYESEKSPSDKGKIGIVRTSESRGRV